MVHPDGDEKVLLWPSTGINKCRLIFSKLQQTLPCWWCIQLRMKRYRSDPQPAPILAGLLPTFQSPTPLGNAPWREWIGATLALNHSQVVWSCLNRSSHNLTPITYSPISLDIHLQGGSFSQTVQLISLWLFNWSAYDGSTDQPMTGPCQSSTNRTT